MALVLGDNLFFGNGMSDLLAKARTRKSGATVFAYHVDHPEAYCVRHPRRVRPPARLVEKPKTPESPWAVTGLYFYDNQCSTSLAAVTPLRPGRIGNHQRQSAILSAVKLLSSG